MRHVDLAIVILLLVVFVAFALVNRETVDVQLPFVEARLAAPLFLVMLGVSVLGMFTGGTVFGFVRHSIQRTSNRRRD
ncbi:LapA family protein [Tautonia sociabilis]|uniref:DUF1049 domain-containing protein n=1 Tax=Tautonia sociabilis TaxID=2080755 RepID=A0A432MNN4_9BACT|nr:hypothetical protein [Tautonia sociabilis]RUL89051.1 hypothetical protein TsocGM_04140 [Tautonia sociabilis]